MAVAGPALADHPARQHVEGGEQGGRPVALVVVGHRSRPDGLDRQRRLGAIQSLDLALLIHAQDHSLLRWVQVQTDDVDELFLEARVVGPLEGLDPIGLDPARGPDPLHRRGRHPGSPGHRPTAPMRSPRRRLMPGKPDDLLDRLGRDRRLRTPTRAHRREILQTVLGEPLPPRRDGPRRDLHRARDPGRSRTHPQPSTTRAPATHHGAARYENRSASQAPTAARQ